ncbi:MAG: right-handed parallel beta-helix repeat-containing protein [Planctomycetia bacterium]|nr:right-handed parallel beta-helix repeat-containing protein [Planctomycetia bacterium]
MKNRFLGFACLVLCASFSFSAENQAAEGVIQKNEAKIQQALDGKTEACASFWGFDPVDSTESLQTAIKAGLKRLRIDKVGDAPWIVRPILLANDLELVLDEGVVLLAKKGDFQKITASLLMIANRKNITVRGLGKGAVLRMNKADYHTDAYKKSEWRHGINIKSSENIRIENLSIEQTGGDGIYLGVATKGVPCKNIHINRVICDENNRQGISVISAVNLLIENTVLKNTNGTAPESGIDFEPNDKSEHLINCIMRNCVCENNNGSGFDFYLPNLEKQSGPITITLENCISRNNKKNGIALTVANGEDLTPEGAILFKNMKLENDHGGILVRSKAAEPMKMLFENIELTLPPSIKNPKRADPSPIQILSRSEDGDPIGGIHFKNVRVQYEADAPVLSFSDSTLNGFGLQNLTGKIVYQNGKDQGELNLSDQWCKQNYPAIALRKIKKLSPDKISDIPFGAPLEKASSARIRNEGTIFLKVEKGKEVCMILRQHPVGRSEARKGSVIITSPSGKVRRFSVVPSFKERTEIRWIADKSGTAKVVFNVGSHAISFDSINVPSALPVYKSVHLVFSKGDLWLSVPEGTKEFAVRFVGEGLERLKATIFDPDGKQIWTEDNIDSAKAFYSEEGKDPRPGLWRIRIDKPSLGVLEDMYIGVLGVPPFLLISEK